MGSVAPSPRWRGSAIDDPIKAKTVELPLHRGEGATMPGHCYGKADSDPPQPPHRAQKVARRASTGGQKDALPDPTTRERVAPSRQADGGGSESASP